MSFTIAQTSLVVHWKRVKTTNWIISAVINAIGAIVTGTVVLVIAVTKFTHGAWLVIVFVPAMVYLFRQISKHYADIAEELHLPLEDESFMHRPVGKNRVVIPVATPTRIVAETLRYAEAIGDEVIALHIAIDEEDSNRVRAKWEAWRPDIKIITIHSPYRLVIEPLLHYIKKLEKSKAPEDFITVVIPEFETKKWWHRFLHNQTGLILRALLLFDDSVVVTAIPYHLKK